MISSMYVRICNRFHTGRANRAKIAFFIAGYPYLTPSFEGNLRTKGTKFCHKKLETLRQPTYGEANGKDFVILACTVLIHCRGVSDRRTDGRQDDG